MVENISTEATPTHRSDSEIELDSRFWENRYQEHTTGWDLGEVSPPLKAYIDQLRNKDLRILIPGCGNSYEAAYLVEQGFTNITVLDIAPSPVQKLRQQFTDAPQLRVLLEDFFTHAGQYNLVLEQTFFCALSPALRPSYVQQMHRLLAPAGRLSGLLFNRTFPNQGPPFGGSREEYEALFRPLFNICIMEDCYNSASPRVGTELFVLLQKP